MGDLRLRRSSSSQAGHRAVGGEHQSTYKTFEPKVTLPIWCAEIKMETQGIINQGLAQLKTHPMGEGQSPTLLMILCSKLTVRSLL